MSRGPGASSQRGTPSARGSWTAPRPGRLSMPSGRPPAAWSCWSTAAWGGTLSAGRPNATRTSGGGPTGARGSPASRRRRRGRRPTACSCSRGTSCRRSRSGSGRSWGVAESYSCRCRFSDPFGVAREAGRREGGWYEPVAGVVVRAGGPPLDRRPAADAGGLLNARRRAGGLWHGAGRPPPPGAAPGPPPGEGPRDEAAVSARGPTGGPLDSLRQITKEIAEAQAPRRQDPKAEPRDLATLLLMPSGDPVLEYRQEQAPLVERG